MRTVPLLLFYLLLVFQTTQGLINKQVKLGHSVTLDCPVGVKDIYWVFLKPPDSPELILQTFSSESTTHFLYNEGLKDKYSTLTSSRLFICNVSKEELGLYYCAKAGNTLQLSDGIRVDVTDGNETQLKQALIVLYVILSIVMFSAGIALFQIKCKVCKKRHRQRLDEELEQLYSTDDEEFSEVEFRLLHSANNTFVPFQKPRKDKYNQE